MASTVRISTAKLDHLLVAAEEMLAVKLATARRAADLRDLRTDFNRWRAESAETGQQGTHLKTLEVKLQAICKAVAQDERTVGRRVDDLLADVKQLLMLPFHTMLDLFPKLARDLSRAQGKEVELVTRGGDVEMDKRILEEMKDVLIHLVRNGIDHGIEKPEERARHGKPLQATVEIAVAQVDDNRVEIVVTDDGAGIDLENVRKVAVKRGMIAGAEARELNDQQALALIFQSDVSTSPIITEISGRGLGLAIVREKTEKLGGRVTVESRPGTGTTFRINIPSVLATFRGILVRAAGRHFVIPTAHVERVARYKRADIKTVENRETISLYDRAISLARLDGVLELLGTVHADRTEYFPIVILVAGDERIAFAVDEVLQEEEVLVKSLARPLTRVRNIAGATIMSGGKVVPVLNVLDLVKSARRPGLAAVAPTTDSPGEQAPAKRMRILIAEDSITSRMLLKNIIEAAGHEVEIAVDGVEALTKLRTADFDLVVSDVEMPRMNGFELTTHIRNDGRLADTPVILVTALSSREDRERGIDVGASAYIVKSSFDQSNLLEAIRRLTA